MKIGGVDPRTLPQEVFLVLPRGEQQIVFRAKGVPNYDEFRKLCPEPEPPKKLTKNGWEVDEENTDYKNSLRDFQIRRYSWLIVRSLEPSEIEWDTVDPSKPSTWVNWDKDLSNAGLTANEIGRVQNLIFEANCLDEDKLKQARDFFVRGQTRAQSESSGLNSAPETSLSGEPA